VTLHLQKDLEALKRRILEMGQIVAERARVALHALLDQDATAARRVIYGDVIAVLKVNSDLERVGDLAVNIAERAAFLATRDSIGIRLDFERMGEKALGMLNDCLRAMVDLDVPLARRVIASDQEVDEMNKVMFVALQDRMVEDPSVIQRAIHYLSASRHLERIGDHATNIAEDVVFLVEGTVIRHQHEEFSQDE